MENKTNAYISYISWQFCNELLVTPAEWQVLVLLFLETFY